MIEGQIEAGWRGTATWGVGAMAEGGLSKANGSWQLALRQTLLLERGTEVHAAGARWAIESKLPSTISGMRLYHVRKVTP